MDLFASIGILDVGMFVCRGTVTALVRTGILDRRGVPWIGCAVVVALGLGVSAGELL